MGFKRPEREDGRLPPRREGNNHSWGVHSASYGVVLRTETFGVLCTTNFRDCFGAIDV
jgi:hypothetical protein